MVSIQPTSCVYNLAKINVTSRSNICSFCGVVPFSWKRTVLLKLLRYVNCHQSSGCGFTIVQTLKRCLGRLIPSVGHSAVLNSHDYRTLSTTQIVIPEEKPHDRFPCCPHCSGSPLRASSAGRWGYGLPTCGSQIMIVYVALP